MRERGLQQRRVAANQRPPRGRQLSLPHYLHSSSPHIRFRPFKLTDGFPPSRQPTNTLLRYSQNIHTKEERKRRQTVVGLQRGKGSRRERRARRRGSGPRACTEPGIAAETAPTQGERQCARDGLERARQQHPRSSCCAWQRATISTPQPPRVHPRPADLPSPRLPRSYLTITTARRPPTPRPKNLRVEIA